MSPEQSESGIAESGNRCMAKRIEICRELAEIGSRLDEIAESPVAGTNDLLAILGLRRRRAVLINQLFALEKHT